jgi:aminomethyltransferase
MSIPAGLRPSPFQARVPDSLGPDDFIDVGGQAVPLVLSGIDEEYAAFRTTAGMIDFSMLLKWEVSGPRAAEVVDAVFSRNVRGMSPGSIAYGVVVDGDGMMIDDCTVLCYDSQRVRVTGGNPRVGELLDAVLPPGHTLDEVRDSVATVSLQGPRSRQILQKLTTTDVSNEAFPYYSFQTGVQVAGLTAHINRIGFTAELGYEIMVDVAEAVQLWDVIAEAGAEFGVVPCAAAALMVVRVEAGMIMSELEYDETTSPFECRMGWAVDLDKPAFHGRGALVALKEMARRTVASVRVDSAPEGLDGAVLTVDGEPIGHITMAVKSPALEGQTLALARLDRSVSKPGQRLTIATEFGVSQAEVVPMPVYDPERTKVRS